MEGLRHSILGWFSHWFSLHVSCLHILRHPPCRTSPLREKRSSQCAGNFGTSTESPRAQRRRNLSLKMQLFWWNKSWPRYTQAVSTDEPILRLQQTFENLGGETERIFKKMRRLPHTSSRSMMRFDKLKHVQRHHLYLRYPLLVYGFHWGISLFGTPRLWPAIG